MMTIVLAIKLAVRFKPPRKPLRAMNMCLDTSGSSTVSVNKVTLPELLPKKDIKSEVWCHFGLRHEDKRPIKVDKPVCMLGFSNVTAKDDKFVCLPQE